MKQDRLSKYNLIIIGGGPAGISAALKANEIGIKYILLVERGDSLGGILQQCIHDGFGVYEYGEALTGPEYAAELLKKIKRTSIETELCCDVSELSRNTDGRYRLKLISPSLGIKYIFSDSIILASGCRERTRGQLKIPGSRPAGIFTAGQLQYMMNIQNMKPGKSAVILGSGDIGLIMARRMKWEGIDVKLVLGEHASGLIRNYVQCVRDWEIPICFGYTIISIHGRKRVKGVNIAPIDAYGRPDLRRKRYICCDTLVIAAGLEPENDLWKDFVKSTGEVPQPINGEDQVNTQFEGFFVCGNLVRQYDTVEEVTASGRNAGLYAAKYITSLNGGGKFSYDNESQISSELEKINNKQLLSKRIIDDADMEYLMSGSNNGEEIKKTIYCISCPRGCRMQADKDLNIKGNDCNIGMEYAVSELEAPRRNVTTTIRVKGGNSLIPVKTDGSVRKMDVYKVLRRCRRKKVELPIRKGEIIICDVLQDGSGINIIACTDMSENRLATIEPNSDINIISYAYENIECR